MSRKSLEKNKKIILAIMSIFLCLFIFYIAKNSIYKSYLNETAIIGLIEEKALLGENTSLDYETIRKNLTNDKLFTIDKLSIKSDDSNLLFKTEYIEATINFSTLSFSSFLLEQLVFAKSSLDIYEYTDNSQNKDNQKKSQQHTQEQIIFATAQKLAKILNNIDYLDQDLYISDLTINYHKNLSSDRNPQKNITRQINLKSLTIRYDTFDETMRIKASYNTSEKEHLLNISYTEQTDKSQNIIFNISDLPKETNVSVALINSSEGVTSGTANGKIIGFNFFIANLLGLNEKLKFEISKIEETDISANFVIDKHGTIKLDNLILNNPAFSALVEASINLSPQIQINTKVVISNFEYSKLAKSKQELLTSVRSNNIDKKILESFYKNSFLKLLADDVEVNILLDTDKANFNNLTGSIHLNASLNSNGIFINNSKAYFDDGTNFTIARANIKHNKTRHNIPPDSKSDRVTRVFFFSPDVNQFSEYFYLRNIKFSQENDTQTIKDVFFLGEATQNGSLINFHKLNFQTGKNKLSGRIKLELNKDINLDAIINYDNLYITEQKVEDGSDRLTNLIEKTRTISTFFKVSTIKLLVKNFHLPNINLKDFSASVQLTDKVIDIENMFFTSAKTGEVYIKSVLDVEDFQPKITNLDIYADKLDINNLLHGKETKATDEFNFYGDWDKNTIIDWSALQSYEINTKIEVGKLKFKHFELQNFTTQISLKDNNASIADSKFEIYDSKMNFSGKFTVDFPSFVLTIVSSEMDLRTLLKELTGQDYLSGKVNFSASIGTSGNTEYRLINNLRGSINAIITEITTDGFDLEGYSKTLPVAKRVDHIDVISQKFLNTGSTNFGYTTAILKAQNGKLSFSDIPLKSRYVSDGSATGVIDLTNWSYNIESRFKVLTFDSLVVRLKSSSSGLINKPKQEWDYQDAKRYWEDKFYSGRI